MYFCGTKVEARPKSPLFWGFQITYSWTHTLFRAHLNKWSVRLPDLYLHNTQQTQETSILVLTRIWTRDPSSRATSDLDHMTVRTYIYIYIYIYIYLRLQYSTRELQKGKRRIKERMSVFFFSRDIPVVYYNHKIKGGVLVKNTTMKFSRKFVKPDDGH